MLSFCHTQVPTVVPGFHVWSAATVDTTLTAFSPHVRWGGEGEWRVLRKDGECGGVGVEVWRCVGVGVEVWRGEGMM